MEYKLYVVLPAYEWQGLDANGRETGECNLHYADDHWYAVEVWSDSTHYERTEKFFSLEEAQKFIKENQ